MQTVTKTVAETRNEKVHGEPVKLLKRIGSTVYSVTIRFSENATETMQDKLLRLILTSSGLPLGNPDESEATNSIRSLLPDTIKLNDKYYNEYIKKIAVTDYARKILAGLLDEQQFEAEIIADEQAKSAEKPSVATPTPAPQAAIKPAAATPPNTPQSGGAAQAARTANNEKRTA